MSALAPPSPPVVEGLAPVPLPTAVAAMQRAAAAVARDVACRGTLRGPVLGLAWDAAQVVAHLTVQLECFVEFAAGTRDPAADTRSTDPPGGPERVAAVNDRLLPRALERDPREAAERLQEASERLAATLLRSDPDAPFASWEAVTDVRTGCLTMLSELLVHGWDLRRRHRSRTARPDPELSALAWHAVLRLMPAYTAPSHLPDRPAVVALRIGGGPTAVVVTRGPDKPVTVSAEPPPDLPVSATLAGDAGVLLLLANGRLSPLRAAATGRVRVHGSAPLTALRSRRWFASP